MTTLVVLKYDFHTLYVFHLMSSRIKSMRDYLELSLYLSVQLLIGMYRNA